MILIRNIICVALLLFSFDSVQAQTIFARSSGDWDVPARWSTVSTGGPSCGCTPGPGDNVLIDGYDIDIDAGTGDVTIADIKITDARGVDVRLRIQGGATLTVTNDFEIENNSAPNLAELIVEDNGSGLDVTGDFLADQNNGIDLLIDVDDDCQVNILSDCNFLQDGGEDIDLSLNINSGTSAQWNVTGDFLWDHNGGDDMRLYVDDASSLVTVGGDMTVNFNSGDGDDFTVNGDGGDINITGTFTLQRALTTSELWLDMDGCDMSMGAFVVTSSGALFTDGAVWIELDQDSKINCSSFSSTFTGGDDLYIHLNENAGNAAEFNVTNDMTLTRSAGDDIEIFIDDDNSVLSVGGNFLANTSGPDSEELEIVLDNNGTFDVTGNFTINTIDGEDVAGNRYIIQLAGGTDLPLFHVGGNFSWTNTINLVDCDIDLNGGTFDIDNDFTITQNAGGDDFDIEIDEAAIATIGGNMSMNLNGGDDMSLSFGLNSATTSQWTVTGNCEMIHNVNNGGSTFEHFVYDDSRYTILGNLTLTTTFNAAPVFLTDLRNTAEISVGGNVIMNAPQSGELEIRPQNTTFYRIGGNFIRAAAPNNFGEMDCSSGTPTIEYMGSIAQIIAEDAGGGGDSFYYYNLEVDNSFGTTPQLTLEGVVTVNGDLTMNDGVVASDATIILIVANNGSTSNASNNSYVDGYTRKVGINPYIFPVGDAGFYGPISMTAPANATDQFEAQYFHYTADVDGFDSSMHDNTVNYISKVEYWRLNRTAGMATPQIALSWDTPRSGGVGDITALRFMRWDGVTWKDLGQTSVTGNTTSGTLENNVGFGGEFADNRPYTLGTTDNINPLPIVLLYFDAKLNNDQVDLSWVTKSETDNDYFTLEKSKDGINWKEFSQIDGAGSSVSDLYYDDVDLNPYMGLSYYRLKQTDFNGDYEYSQAVAVSRDFDLAIFPNPADGDVIISGEFEIGEIEVYNAIGQKIPLEIVEENGLLTFSTQDLVNGTYLIVFSNAAITGVKKLIVSH
jgi:Secretion system C-terminal sorting domain